MVKRQNEGHAQKGDLTWEDILTEEFWEALAEAGNDDKLEAELIQVAAVTVGWIECIRRRRGVK